MHFRTILDISEDIKSKRLSPVEVTEHMLERIETNDSVIRSYLTVTSERAIKQAKRAEKEIMSGLWRGPLHGISLGIKDIIHTDFAKTTAGTSIHRNFQPTCSATVVERLENHGAISLGKLATTEQAFSEHHPSVPIPRNPWNPGYFVGASSSGSGAATAAGLAFGTLGSDTGGSIRLPCAANGITGLKPTWGRVSRHGAFALADSLDHIGPMARSAADVAIMLGAMAGHDPRDPTSLKSPVPDYLSECSKGIQGLRVGMPWAYATDDVDPEVVDAWQNTADIFQLLGAELKPTEHPEWADAVSHWPALCSAETAWAHRNHHPAQKEHYGPALSGFIEHGQNLNPVQLAGANISRLEFKGRMNAFFESMDVFLIPVFPTKVLKQSDWEAMADGDFSSYVRYAIPADLTGNPTITFPAGFDSNGLPIAMQLCGPHLSEAMLLRAAAAFQRVTDWHTRHPM
jgi:amidase